MGHHVHSPYTYALFTNVLFERWQYYSFERIENFRRKTSRILQSCPSDQPKYAQLLQRLCATNNAKTILQLGTGSGITAMYLASNDTKSTVYTCNGKKENSRDNASNFRLMKCDNIRVLAGGETHGSASLQAVVGNLDFLFVRPSQGFHDIQQYYERFKLLRNETSIFVFDRIHSTPDLETQWNKIYKSPEVTLSLDLYELGIVWFRSELKKQHYIVKY